MTFRIVHKPPLLWLVCQGRLEGDEVRTGGEDITAILKTHRAVLIIDALGVSDFGAGARKELARAQRGSGVAIAVSLLVLSSLTGLLALVASDTSRMRASATFPATHPPPTCSCTSRALPAVGLPLAWKSRRLRGLLLGTLVATFVGWTIPIAT